jgi:hypothetical protein
MLYSAPVVFVWGYRHEGRGIFCSPVLACTCASRGSRKWDKRLSPLDKLRGSGCAVGKGSWRRARLFRSAGKGAPSATASTTMPRTPKPASGDRRTARNSHPQRMHPANFPATLGLHKTVAPHLDFCFDIFQFPFRFNPGTKEGNVEMGLINKGYPVTLNQRVQGSSPCAPTNHLIEFKSKFLRRLFGVLHPCCHRFQGGSKVCAHTALAHFFHSAVSDKRGRCARGSIWTGRVGGRGGLQVC